MSEPGESVDELEFDLFAGSDRGLWNNALTHGDDSLLRSGNTTLDHDVVFVDDTVVWESTERGDGFLGQGVVVDASVLVLDSLTNTVDLLVELGTVVVTTLTSTGNRPCNTSRMPGTNTSDLSETSVSLAGKTSDTPTGDNTSVSFTLGNTNSVDHVVLLDDGVAGTLSLEEFTAEVDLLGNGTTLDLDFQEVSLLLAETNLADVSVGENADDLAVLLHASKFSFHVLVVFVSNTGSVAGESLLLAAVPVFVETTFDRFRQMFSPDSGEGAKTTRGFVVTNQTNDNHRRSFDDGDSFDGFLLVELGSWFVDVTEDVSATGLVTHESGQMARISLVVLGKSLDATLRVDASLSWQETKGTTTWVLVFTMRHFTYLNGLKSFVFPH